MKGGFRNTSHTLLEPEGKPASDFALERTWWGGVHVCQESPQNMTQFIAEKSTLFGWSEYPEQRMKLESSQEIAMPPAPGRRQSELSIVEAKFIPDLKVVSHIKCPGK